MNTAPGDVHLGAGDWPPPLEILNLAGTSPIVLLCEHAARHIPAEYADLGLDPSELTRHIAWDIGAAAVTRILSELLDAPAFLGTYSRLLIDLNRPSDAPSAIPVCSEATDIPGNIGLSAAERARRIERIFTPFHAAVAACLSRRQEMAVPTLLVTIHSFTPVFLGRARPWHAGILYDAARDFGDSVLAGLAADPGLMVAAQEPYVIARDEDYAIPIHGDDRSIPAILVEIRNDEIAGPTGAEAWARRLAEVLRRQQT